MSGVVVVSMILFAAGTPSAAPAEPAAATAAKAAPATTVAEAVATGKAKDDPMRVICKSELPVGSRLPVKRCTTQGEAAMRQLEDRQALEKMQGDTYRH